MAHLSNDRARSAVARALAQDFVIPPQGERIAEGVVEFDLVRRGKVLEPALRYRVRVDEENVLLGHFVGGQN